METRASRGPSAPTAEDDAAMRRLAAGEAEALRDLMRRHGEAVLNVLHRMTGDRTAAEDLAQETFLRIYRKAATYRPGRGLRPWLFTIARNLALNHRRRRAVEARPIRHPGDRNPRPDRSIENEELQQRIQSALDRIDEPFRAALVLCVLEGLSYEEAAEVCGCPVKTISSRLARGRAQFRALMEPYLGGAGHE